LTFHRSAMAPVTVIVPCYRCHDTIQRAVESVARQTLVPAEVILVDDCSDDCTLACLNHLRDAYGHGWIRVLTSPRNGGPSVARNAGWNVASQPYVAFLDADDSWHPQKIEIQYQWMSTHPDVAFSGHRFSVKRDLAPPKSINAASVEATSFSRSALLLSNRFSTPTVMLKRSIGNRFEEAKRHSEDFLLWLEICLQGQAGVSLSAELTYLHKAPFGEAGLSRDLGAMARGELDTYSRLFGQGYINRLECALLQSWSMLKYTRRIALKATQSGTLRFQAPGHLGRGGATATGMDVPARPLPQTPLVSIVTPSHNTGRYIAETLRSVQDQAYPRVEHIVLDSNSTDQTLEILTRFPSVTVIRDAPAEMCEKVNLGFSLARGDIVAWLCADDFYLPGAIGKAVDALKENPDAALVYCNSLHVDEQSVEIRRTRKRQTEHRQLVHEQNCIPHPTVFMRREALDAVGPVDVRFPLVCDWDLWIRISRRFTIRYVDDWWAAFRERPDQLSQTSRFTAWLQGRQMTRAHGAAYFLPHSWTYWRRMISRAAVITRGRAVRAVHSKLRDVRGGRR
jgi:glycosyltransferase involved in cell wall biosynthesis